MSRRLEFESPLVQGRRPSLLLAAVESDILRHRFRDLRLLEEALTHPSCLRSPPHYQRLEFFGDSAICLAVTNHLYEAYPDLDPGQLSLLRAANISTQKLARSALRSGLYWCLRHHRAGLDDKVRKYAKAVGKEEGAVVHGESVRAPKVLADIVKSVAAAVFVDVNLNLKRLWVTFRHLLEPIVTLDELRCQPQPVIKLYELRQKKGQTVHIHHCQKGAEHREIAKLYTADLSLSKVADRKVVREREEEAVARKKLCRRKLNLPSILDVDAILGYEFRNISLLEEALTHSSYDERSSYERLEFMGDAVLGLAISCYIYSAYPKADQGQLSLLRSANISNEKLARVALKHGLHRYLKHSTAILDDKVREFARAVEEDGHAVIYGGSVKAPKTLADITESVAAAVYVDIGFDLQHLWVIFRGLLEPIVTLEDLQLQPQPVTLLYELCQKKGKTLTFRHWKKQRCRIVWSVYVDGTFIASGSSENMEIAKLNAAKAALLKLSGSELLNGGLVEIANRSNGPFEIEGGKQKLHELCGKKGWEKPNYSTEEETGQARGETFLCSTKIPTSERVLYMTGEEMTRVRDAEISAASLMIRALYDSNLLP